MLGEIFCAVFGGVCDITSGDSNQDCAGALSGHGSDSYSETITDNDGNAVAEVTVDYTW